MSATSFIVVNPYTQTIKFDSMYTIPTRVEEDTLTIGGNTYRVFIGKAFETHGMHVAAADAVYSFMGTVAFARMPNSISEEVVSSFTAPPHHPLST